MAGLVPAIHDFLSGDRNKTWMARLNRAMTVGKLVILPIDGEGFLPFVTLGLDPRVHWT
jgi:hypothetical protein